MQSVELKVDAALIEQLRAGYAQLGSEVTLLPWRATPASELLSREEVQDSDHLPDSSHVLATTHLAMPR